MFFYLFIYAYACLDLLANWTDTCKFAANHNQTDSILCASLPLGPTFVPSVSRHKGELCCVS